MSTIPALRQSVVMGALLLGAVGCARPPVDAPPKSVVFFTNRSAVLDDGAIGPLDEFTKDALSHPRLPVLVEGYSDPTNTPQQNRALSQARAEAVANALAARGVDRSRITLRPRAPTPGTDPGIEGRRVELELGS